MTDNKTKQPHNNQTCKETMYTVTLKTESHLQNNHTKDLITLTTLRHASRLMHQHSLQPTQCSQEWGLAAISTEPLMQSIVRPRCDINTTLNNKSQNRRSVSCHVQNHSLNHSHCYAGLAEGRGNLGNDQNGPWTKTAHSPGPKRPTWCQKRPTATSKISHSLVKNGPQNVCPVSVSVLIWRPF